MNNLNKERNAIKTMLNSQYGKTLEETKISEETKKTKMTPEKWPTFSIEGAVVEQFGTNTLGKQWLLLSYGSATTAKGTTKKATLMCKSESAAVDLVGFAVGDVVNAVGVFTVYKTRKSSVWSESIHMVIVDIKKQ